MRISAQKIVFSCFLLFFACFFSSCENELKICADSAGVNFDYKINFGKEFLSIFSAALGSDSAEEEQNFNAEEIAQIFIDSKFENISAKNLGSGNFLISGRLSETAEDPVSKSGMISLSENSFSIKISRENLLEFYRTLPEDFQNYLDMLMAPAFTGEEMSDGEYVELLSEVYGQALADEVSAASVKIAVVSPSGMKKNYSVRLVEILNIKNALVFAS